MTSNNDLQKVLDDVSNKLSRQYSLTDLYPYQKRVSSSQLKCLKDDPKEFFNQYVLDERTKSVPMVVGAIFSDAYAGNENSLELLSEIGEGKLIATFKTALEMMVRSKDAEKELIVPFQEWDIRITLDGYNKYSDKTLVIENKTGKRKWDDERARKEFQILLQAWGIWKLEGIIPEVLVQWVDTNPNTTKLLNQFTIQFAELDLQLFEEDQIIPLLILLETGHLV